MKRTAVFPGSFDPITKGHESVIIRASGLFEQIIIAVGVNPEKNYFFPAEKRVAWIRKVFRDYPNISVEQFDGLTVDFCRKMGANYILRGLRTSADFDFERAIGQTNKNMYSDIETVFLLTTPEFTHINSSIVRNILSYGGDVSMFVPDSISISKNDKM